MNLNINQQWTSQLSGKNKAKYEKELENRFNKLTKVLKAHNVVAGLLSYDWDAIRKFNKSIQFEFTNNAKSISDMEKYNQLCNQINDEISKSRKDLNKNQIQNDLFKTFKEMNAEDCQ